MLQLKCITVACLILCSCATNGSAATAASNSPDEPLPGSTMAKADVISVEVSQRGSGYRFTVGIRSPDTGCKQYADWWEIVTAEGELIYRRILAHSHVDENPFTRSSLKPIDVDPDSQLIVRAHMNSTGYGGVVQSGTINAGFRIASNSPELPAILATAQPQPNRCSF